MKKRVIAVILGMAMMMTAAGCGSDAGSTTEGTEAAEETGTAESTEAVSEVVCASSAFDLKGSDYVKLCDYTDFEVTITGDYDVEDEEIKEYLAQLMAAYGPFYTADPDKTTIGDGDIVDVDYVGKLDGVAFDGGSAENQIIDVDNNVSVAGSNAGSTYIDGFTDGLKGASVGEVIDCDVTFPDDYGNTDLAGKAVVFTFTVNAVQKEMTVEDVDDDFAMEQFGVDTVEEMYEQLRYYLEQYAEYTKQNDTYTAVQNYLIDNSEVEVSSDYLEARLGDYETQFIDIYCDGDESQLESYLSTYYGKTVEEMEETWSEGMEKSIRLELIMDAIAEELGITIDEEEYADYVEQMVTNNGYDSAELMYSLYGYGDAVYGERYFRNLYIYDQALEVVVANATVNVEPEASGVDAEDAVDTEGTEAE